MANTVGTITHGQMLSAKLKGRTLRHADQYATDCLEQSLKILPIGCTAAVIISSVIAARERDAPTRRITGQRKIRARATEIAEIETVY